MRKVLLKNDFVCNAGYFKAGVHEIPDDIFLPRDTEILEVEKPSEELTIPVKKRGRPSKR